jgi:2-phosphosulfolactate phosphatase
VAIHSGSCRILAGQDLRKGPPAGTVVVIDNLRASSIIVTALEAGVGEVLPTTDDAEAYACRRAGCVLAGETGGIRIAGYDIGNSPVELLQRHASRPFTRLVLNTSNCVPVLMRCASAVVCSSLNLDAVARYVAGGPVTIVAVGGAHGISEDMGVALALAGSLTGVAYAAESVACFTRESNAARQLRAIGYGADVDFISRVNTSTIVPLYNGTTIVSAHAAGHR